MADVGVTGFYDTHPINEDEILTKLRASGADLAALTEDELREFDHDNYGGPRGVEVLAMRAAIRRDHHVLDVCSGMGGPARWLSHRIGCRVTGIDLTQSRVDAANRLTQRVGLDSLVDFVHGDATDMDLPDTEFDAVVSQEAWLHIPAKDRLIFEVTRVLKRGGLIAFTDTTLRRPLSSDEGSRLALELQASGIVPAKRYVEVLTKAGCEVVGNEDLSGEWTEVLVNRLEMFRSLRDTTVQKFGVPHFERWDSLYTFYVGLFAAGKLGGARITARRLAQE